MIFKIPDQKKFLPRIASPHLLDWLEGLAFERCAYGFFLGYLCFWDLAWALVGPVRFEVFLLPPSFFSSHMIFGYDPL